MNEEQDFYDIATGLAAEGAGELVSAPMGLGQGDPDEARRAIAHWRAEMVAMVTSAVAELTADTNCPGHRWGAWSEEWPYVACRVCGLLESVPPAPLPGSPPRWALWLGGNLRRRGGQRMGANGHLRVAFESVLLFEKVA